MAKREPTSINVDADLWKKAKIEAINRDTTLTELFEEALRVCIAKKKRYR